MPRKNYDKLIARDSLALLTTIPFKWRTISKIDADSVPAATFAGMSISVMDNTSDEDNVAYMWYACYDDGNLFEQDRIIAHGAISPGGGNTYLRLNRKIWRKTAGEVGGPITIWVECSDNVDSTTICSTAYTLRARQSS